MKALLKSILMKLQTFLMIQNFWEISEEGILTTNGAYLIDMGGGGAADIIFELNINTPLTQAQGIWENYDHWEDGTVIIERQ